MTAAIVEQQRDVRQACGVMPAGLTIQPYFQPIVDFYTASVLGYEVLSRGSPPHTSPAELFTLARREGFLWELEKACRLAALARISSFTDEQRGYRYFMNVSPDVFNDPRFESGFTAAALQQHGLSAAQIVMEITEEASILDHMGFEKQVRHYLQQGFSIAIDDFGAGNSSLKILVAAAPQFIKIDRAIIRNINADAYKQHLLKALVSFASSVEARLIAEGIETAAELETLFRLGIRYGQGFFLARPAPYLPLLAPDALEALRGLVVSYNQPKADLDETVLAMLVTPLCIEKGKLSCREADALFQGAPHLDHLVITEKGKPVAILTRQHFYLSTGGRFGYPLFQNRPVEMIAKPDFLIVENTLPITRLARLAMERLPADLYDPVVVIDQQGRLAGTVTMKQVVVRAAELEVKAARGANPLTGLPGNREIHRWIYEVIRERDFFVIYADLDRFKEYNDTYGFLMGDEMIRLEAEVLSEHLPRLGREARLGHIGGDDMVVVGRGEVAAETLKNICRAFDERRLSLFRDEDAKAGAYTATDRQGRIMRVPLVCLCLVAIEGRNLMRTPHPALLAQLAASSKKAIKKDLLTHGQSAFFFERRRC